MIRPPAVQRELGPRRWPARLGRWWLVLTLGAAIVAFSLWFRVLNRSVTPHGDLVDGIPSVLSLQVAYTEDRFSAVLEEWSGEPCVVVADAEALDLVRAGEGYRCALGPGVTVPGDGIEAFKRNLILADFVFPVVYSLFAVAALLWAWPRAGRGSGPGAAAAAAVVMGGADWVENTLHLVVLRDVTTYAEAAAANFPGQLILAASLAATVKIVLIAVFTVLVAAGLAVRAGRWLRRHRLRLVQ